MRVWFARLQMPVLRVAVAEPDFFGTLEHPARRLIDRMGSCVMGFDAATRSIGERSRRRSSASSRSSSPTPTPAGASSRRCWPSSRNSSSTTSSTENEATRKGVSLAQQVEQHETLAIQYTIELRRMLNEVPVQEGVREFLFQVWADVLAMTAVRYGAQGEETRAMKRAAADLIWAASAKPTREERAEVIRRLPLLLKRCARAWPRPASTAARQDEHISPRTTRWPTPSLPRPRRSPPSGCASWPSGWNLEDCCHDAADVTDRRAMVLRPVWAREPRIEVVADGGSMPTPAMVAWARELQLGNWFMLDHNGRQRGRAVRLARRLRKQLRLFVPPQGRCYCSSSSRLAAYLQAGLLLPAEDEALTCAPRASALAKLDVDSERLLN